MGLHWDPDGKSAWGYSSSKESEEKRREKELRDRKERNVGKTYTSSNYPDWVAEITNVVTQFPEKNLTNVFRITNRNTGEIVELRAYWTGFPEKELERKLSGNGSW